MKLNKEQEQALNILKSGRNVFITGSAGTGKSTLIEFYKRYCNQRGVKIALTSTTGISALLINGTTIHSFAGIKTGNVSIGQVLSNKFAVKNWKEVEVLVIDEISMLKPEIFELLNNIAKAIRQNEQPFGNIQIVATGDFAQLPPVYIEEETKFCFESPIWDEIFPITNIIHLKQIMRQSDNEFKKCLQEIRANTPSEETIALLNTRIREPRIINGIIPTKLYAVKADVNEINNREIQKLIDQGNELQIYDASITFSTNNISDAQKNLLRDRINKSCPALDNLILPIGAQVMVIFNISLEAGIVNGSRGVLIDFIEGFPKIRLLNGTEIVIPRQGWNYKEYNSKINVIKSQIPLIPAYALTIHKSQGATLDTAIIDVGSKIFEHGQLYTALSRVKSIDNLYLINFDKTRIICNQKVKSFYTER